MRLRKPFLLLAWHALLGFAAKFFPPAFIAYYFLIIIRGAFKVIETRDRDYCAAKYGLYIMGLEVLYRMCGPSVFWELGKYACGGIFFLALMVGGQRSDIRPFFLYIVLLFPAVFLTSSDEGFNEWRKMIMFNLSGPISFAFAGMYFFKRKIQADQLWNVLRWAILPGIPLVVLLFLGPSTAEVSFNTESNFALSGGFGPNQVSTCLGYFLVLLIFSIWNKQVLTLNRTTDYVLAILLAYRAMLTFSRGGLFAVGIAAIATILGLMLLSAQFRRQAVRYCLGLVVLFIFFLGAFMAANQATDNWLLYRYQGYSRVQVESGRFGDIGQGYLANRDSIIFADLELFQENWFLGVGVGMSKQKRGGALADIAAHTELSRLLAEHGLFGALALLLLLIKWPFQRLFSTDALISRKFFILFFALGILTMTHAAMRLALPGIVTAFAFALIVPDRSGNNIINRQIEV